MRRASLLVIALAVGIGVASCSDDPLRDESDATVSPFAEGTREARAIVAFANDPATDRAALRASGVTTNKTADAVVARRDGADGAPGTADDDPYVTLAEFDAVKGIGPATIEKMATYAIARGYGNERGLYHGTYFTERQADRTLALVNTASAAQLDAATSVDKRALQNIEAARPILSMAHLASISRVKGTAIRLLREHADRELGPAACSSSSECASGLTCFGASAFDPGRCVEVDVEGAGDACSAEGVCGRGLVCAGRSAGFEGICNPAWMRDEYVDESSGGVPDGPSGRVGAGVQVWGLASVPTDAVVRAIIDHPRPDDLELTLENPAGTAVMVWPAGSGAVPRAPEGIPVSVPGDESANGLWVLTVHDTVAGQQGTFSLFALELTTRFD